MHFINHLGNRGADYLHPGGKKSSDYVVGEILKRNPSSVLEIGCGIGATLISLASNGVNNLVGVDISDSQIEMTRRRIVYCKLQDSIQLSLVEKSGQLNFKDHSFDVVFAESVLGILSHQSLLKTIQEIKRVLKPNGVFISNDAIWQAGISMGEVNTINARALKDFGMIQSSSRLIGRNEWERFLVSFGFVSCKIVEIDKLEKNVKDELNLMEMSSQDFTRKQKRYASFNPVQLCKEVWYKIKLSLFHKNDGDYLDYLIFILQA
jgi:SAM-dependent methyltransferase